MKSFLRYSVTLTTLLILTLLLSLQVSAQNLMATKGASRLFSDIDASKSFILEADRTEPNPTVIRDRFVTINFDLLGELYDPSDALVLNLFDDLTLVAAYDRAETNALGSFAWFGHIEGIEYSQVTLVVTHGLLAGSVSTPANMYQIRPVGTNLHVIEEIDQSAFPPELEPVSIDSPQAEFILSDSPQADACDQITVLVPYSPEARAAAGGTAAIEALIAQAVAETNQSYVNSGLVQRLTLVHTMETSPGDAANDFSADLNALQSLSDGIFDNVDAARETYYADEVALIIENSAYCGLGYLNSSAATAFSITHRTCATGYFSFGHELGHNMGAHHDWYVNDTVGYNKGFINLTDRWRTIMAYNTLCSDHGTGNCTRLQYWSNPDVSYGSPADPMGISSTGPNNCIAGSTSPDPSSCAADNRTRLNNTCNTVANFRSDPAQNGTIIVEKQTIPDGATDAFSFTGDASGSISDGQQIVVGNLAAGTYTSQEVVPQGWSLTSIVCDDANSTGSLANQTATFELEAGETVICAFTNEKEAYDLTVNKVGSGSVTANPDQATYNYGDVVALTAVPDPGWTFAGWSGDASGTANPTSITMDGNKSVTATFTQDDYSLTVNVVGNGSVTVNPDQATYNYGDVAALTAVPDPGWTFAGWSGDASGTANPTSITMDGNKSVTATFTVVQYELIVSLDGSGNGSVISDPTGIHCDTVNGGDYSVTFDYGTVVTLKASAFSHSTFVSWGGACSGTGTCQVTLTENISVSAIFESTYTLFLPFVVR